MEHESYRTSLTKYSIGFILSLITTLGAYAIATGHTMMGGALLATLGILAIVQMTVQLLFFLHLGSDVWSRLRLASLGFMLLILLIVVIGSLWIMENLNYNMMHMTSDQKIEYMLNQKDKGF